MVLKSMFSLVAYLRPLSYFSFGSPCPYSRTCLERYPVSNGIRVFYLGGLTQEKIGWLIENWVDAAGQFFNSSRGRCVLSKDIGRCNPEFIRLQRKCPQVELTFLVEGSRELSMATLWFKDPAGTNIISIALSYHLALSDSFYILWSRTTFPLADSWYIVTLSLF